MLLASKIYLKFEFEDVIEFATQTTRQSSFPNILLTIDTQYGL